MHTSVKLEGGDHVRAGALTASGVGGLSSSTGTRTVSRTPSRAHLSTHTLPSTLSHSPFHTRPFTPARPHPPLTPDHSHLTIHTLQSISAHSHLQAFRLWRSRPVDFRDDPRTKQPTPGKATALEMTTQARSLTRIRVFVLSNLHTYNVHAYIRPYVHTYTNTRAYMHPFMYACIHTRAQGRSTLSSVFGVAAHIGRTFAKTKIGNNLLHQFFSLLEVEEAQTRKQPPEAKLSATVLLLARGRGQS